MRNNLVFLLGIVIVGMLQPMLLDYIKIFNTKPDLLLVIVCLSSLFLNLRGALVLSVFAGLFKDAFLIGTFGLNVIDSNLLRMCLVFIIVALHNTIYGLINIYSGNFIPLGIFLRIVSVGSLYTSVVSPLLFRIIKPFLAKPL
jgi:cell shape-determining protein MreD